MNDNISNIRYVAFFDMLGFKEAVKRDLDEAWGALEDLRVSMEENLNMFIKTPDQIIIKNNNDRVIATNFSDSVLIFTQGNTIEDLHRILLTSAGFFARSLHRCVLLRGAISYGTFNYNFEKNLFCGLPLIKAYELGQNAQWSGIIIDDKVAEDYYRNPITSFGQKVIEQKIIPVKGKHSTTKEKLWVFNWVLPHKQNFTIDGSITPQLYSSAFESLFKSSYKDWPEYIQAIYDNTVEFINSVLEREGS
jgi:hypothetical protein